MKKKYNRDIILFDIDHTLSDASWRDDMIGNVSWDEYHKAGEQDKPIEEMVRFHNALVQYGTYVSLGLTSIEEKWRSMRTKWLVTNKIFLTELIMRPSEDRTPTAELKPKMCESFFGSGWEDRIAFIVDDNEKVIDAFAALGVPAFHFRGRILKNG